VSAASWPRRHAVPLALAIAALVAAGLFHRPLIDWFRGPRHGAPTPVAAPAPVAPDAAAPPALPRAELAAPALDTLHRGFAAYERVRAELAGDRLDGVAAPAREASQALHAAQAALTGAPPAIADATGQAAAAADRLAAATDLPSARRAFGELGRLLIAIGAADPRLQDGWRVFECPMAEGFQRWFQRPDALENPYMGPRMSTCGSASTWEPAAAAPAAAPANPDEIAYYTCAMHPSVHKDGPGICPICAMTLTPVTRGELDSGVIVVDDSRRAQIGLRTAPAVRAPMTRAIRAVGRVAYDESRLEDVTLKLGGWIAKLHVTATGQPVGKGDLLFTLYSPELYAAQQEYLLARGRTAPGAAPDPLVRASEKKLHLWGLGDAQLAAIATRGEPLEEVPFTSPASGYVIEKDIVEGAAVQPGQRLFRIAALDRVWVEADVYEADLALIRAGQRATISLSYLPDRRFDGKVALVLPSLDGASRTGRVRIALPNPGTALRPEMYASVDFQIDLGPRLQVPIGAVVYTGPRRLVFVDIGGGRLRPQEVQLGARNDEQVEIVAGLHDGDQVVTAGNFLIAAESRIRSSSRFWSEERAGGAP